ncbi:MAG: HDIG domain-containing protein [Methanomassiliicoccales archaeon]|nr:HDIG domain-containing protein [Methanomassiliicoccales archaeon]
MPGEKECIRILKEEGCKRSVLRHVCTVRLIAVEMAARSGADLPLVTAAALLHDVGRSRTQTVMHVAESVRILRERGMPERLVQVIGRHVAAGFTDQEASALGLPPGDYMPRTLEDKIVCHADNLVKGERGMLTLEEAVAEVERKGHKSTGERMRAMHRELSEACGLDVDDIVMELRARKIKDPCAARSARRGARP